MMVSHWPVILTTAASLCLAWLPSGSAATAVNSTRSLRRAGFASANDHHEESVGLSVDDDNNHDNAIANGRQLNTLQLTDRIALKHYITSFRKNSGHGDIRRSPRFALSGDGTVLATELNRLDDQPNDPLVTHKFVHGAFHQIGNFINTPTQNLQQFAINDQGTRIVTINLWGQYFFQVWDRSGGVAWTKTLELAENTAPFGTTPPFDYPSRWSSDSFALNGLGNRVVSTTKENGACKAMVLQESTTGSNDGSSSSSSWDVIYVGNAIRTPSCRTSFSHDGTRLVHPHYDGGMSAVQIVNEQEDGTWQVTGDHIDVTALVDLSQEHYFDPLVSGDGSHVMVMTQGTEYAGALAQVYERLENGSWARKGNLDAAVRSLPYYGSFLSYRAGDIAYHGERVAVIYATWSKDRLYRFYRAVLEWDGAQWIRQQSGYVGLDPYSIGGASIQFSLDGDCLASFTVEGPPERWCGYGVIDSAPTFDGCGSDGIISEPTCDNDGDGGSGPSDDTTESPTGSPVASPSASPTALPTSSPSSIPTISPTESPTVSPTNSPTVSPSLSPTVSPSSSPTSYPSSSRPTANPTSSPSATPTAYPTVNPTISPTVSPSSSPTGSPSLSPVTDYHECRNLANSRCNCSPTEPLGAYLPCINGVINECSDNLSNQEKNRLRQELMQDCVEILNDGNVFGNNGNN